MAPPVSCRPQFWRGHVQGQAARCVAQCRMLPAGPSVLILLCPNPGEREEKISIVTSRARTASCDTPSTGSPAAQSAGQRGAA